MKLKQLKLKAFDNDSGVAYLIFYMLACVLIWGFVYAVISDMRDLILPFYSSIGFGFVDETMTWGFDLLNFLFSFFFLFAILGLIWFGYTMAQKPEAPWQ